MATDTVVSVQNEITNTVAGSPNQLDDTSNKMADTSTVSNVQNKMDEIVDMDFNKMPESASIDQKSPQPRGYDCSISRGSPKTKELYQCAICLLLQREPHLLSCCGAHFCHECITAIKEEGKPCPLCQEKDFSTMLNKSRQREMLDLDVACSFKRDGCPWEGKLRDLEPHTEEKCEYLIVSCEWGCGIVIQRKDVVEHEQKNCPNRPWYLKFDDNQVKVLAERVHKLEETNTCLQDEVKSVKSENERLKVKIEELSVQQSVANQRQEELLAQIRSLSEDIEKLKQQEFAASITALNEEIEKLKEAGDFATKISSVVDEVQKLMDDNSLLREEIEQLATMQRMNDRNSVTKEDNEVNKDVEIEQLATKQRMNDRNSATKEDIEINKDVRSTMDDASSTQSPSPINIDPVIPSSVESSSSNESSLTPFSFTMKSFEHRNQQKVVWFGPPFYTHSGGYKMQLRVDANGTQDGAGTHMSVYVYLMKGEFDEELSWPFRGHVTVRILNQLNDFNHYERVIDFPKGTNPLSVNRVTVGSRVKAGHGYSQFIPHLDLSSVDEECRYLNDNCLKFVIFASVESPSLQGISKIPILGRLLK